MLEPILLKYSLNHVKFWFDHFLPAQMAILYTTYYLAFCPVSKNCTRGFMYFYCWLDLLMRMKDNVSAFIGIFKTMVCSKKCGKGARNIAYRCGGVGRDQTPFHELGSIQDGPWVGYKVQISLLLNCMELNGYFSTGKSMEV